jgi:hypothetical protein
MNARIKQLAASHFPRDCNGDILTTPESICEFAQVIVQECAAYAFSHEEDYYAMLKHFGLER